MIPSSPASVTAAPGAPRSGTGLLSNGSGTFENSRDLKIYQTDQSRFSGYNEVQNRINQAESIKILLQKLVDFRINQKLNNPQNRAVFDPRISILELMQRRPNNLSSGFQPFQQTQLNNAKSLPRQFKERTAKSFNMLKAHQNIEILEGRINDGIDQDHLHPAMAVQMYTGKKVKDITQEEKFRYKNYKPKAVKNKIPGFWVPRAYDESENKMSDEKSEKLKNRIEVFYNSRKLSLAGEDMRLSPTYISMKKFLLFTDDEADETDLDGF